MLLCEFINTMIEQGCQVTDWREDYEFEMRKEGADKYLVVNLKKASVTIYTIEEVGKDKIYADSAIKDLTLDEEGNVYFNKVIKESIF